MQQVQDRFRFRAWNKEKKVYHYQAEKGTCGLPFDILCKSNEFVVEQCTGLKDKNGTLIYEGDVLGGSNGSINGSKWGFETVVKWNKQKAQFDMPIWVYDENGQYKCDDSTHWFEIIGNIHENPELLEAK